MFSARSSLARVPRRIIPVAPVASAPLRAINNNRTPQCENLEHEMLSDDGECYQTFYATTRTITLNRPKQLNALNHNMVKWMLPRLQSDEENQVCQSILVRGAGAKAFCAGGDIVSIAKDAARAQKGDGDAYQRFVGFFRDEYRLDYMTSKLSKPYIPWYNGIVMGGGVGISVHNRVRVATEQSLFAMPETTIGFFPDVGGSHFLPRLDPGLGMYLALTSARLKGADLVHAGVATHFAYNHEFDNLYNKLNDGHETADYVYRALGSVSQPQELLPAFTLEKHMDCIARCFTKGSVEQIIEALNAETGRDAAFAQETIRTLGKMSPLSLKITFEQLQRGSKLDLAECLTQEFRLAQNMMTNPDFTAGVTSLLITKDGKPQWAHKSVKDVPEAAVARFFDLPAGAKDLDLSDVVPARGRAHAELISRPVVPLTVTPPVGAHPYPLYEPLEEFKNVTGDRATWRAAVNNMAFFEKYWGYVLFPSAEGVEPFQPQTVARLQKQMDRLSETMYQQEQIDGKLLGECELATPLGADSIADAFRSNASVTEVPSYDSFVDEDVAPGEEALDVAAPYIPVEKLWAEMALSTRELLGRISDSLGPNQKRLYLLTQSSGDLITEAAAYDTLKRFGLQVEAAHMAGLTRDARIAAENLPAALAALSTTNGPPSNDLAVAEALGEVEGRFRVLPDGREAVADNNVVMLRGVPLDVSSKETLSQLQALMSKATSAADVASADALAQDPLLDLGLVTRFLSYCQLRRVDLMDAAALEGRFIPNLTAQLHQAKLTTHAARVVRFCGFNPRRVEYLRLQLRHFYRHFARVAGLPEAMAVELARLELGNDEVDALGLDASDAAAAAASAAATAAGALSPAALIAKLAASVPAVTATHALGVPMIDRTLLAAHESKVMDAYLNATNPDLAAFLEAPALSTKIPTTAPLEAARAIAASLGVNPEDAAIAELVTTLPAVITKSIAAGADVESFRRAVASASPVYKEVVDWIAFGYTAEEAAAVDSNPGVQALLTRFRNNEPMTATELTLIAALPHAPAGLKQVILSSAAAASTKEWFHAPDTDPNVTHFNMEGFMADARLAAAAGAFKDDSAVPGEIMTKLEAVDAAARAAAAADAAAAEAPEASLLAAAQPPAGSADPLANLTALLDLRLPAPAPDAASVRTLAARVAMNRFVLKALDADAASAAAAAAAVTPAVEVATAAAAAAKTPAATGDADLDAILYSVTTAASPAAALPLARAALAPSEAALFEAKRLDLAVRSAQVAFLSEAAAPELQTADAVQAAERVVAIAERLANLRRRAPSEQRAAAVPPAPAPRAELSAPIPEEISASVASAKANVAATAASDAAARFLPEDAVFATMGLQELAYARQALQYARVMSRAEVSAATYTSTVTVALKDADGKAVAVTGPSVKLGMTVAEADAAATVEHVNSHPFPNTPAPLRLVEQEFGQDTVRSLFVDKNQPVDYSTAFDSQLVDRVAVRMQAVGETATPDLTRWSAEDDTVMSPDVPHAGSPIAAIENDAEVNYRAFNLYLGITDEFRPEVFSRDMFLHAAPLAAHDPMNAAGSNIVVSKDPREYVDMDSYNVSVPAVPAGYYAARKQESRDERVKVLMSGLRFISRDEVLSGEYKIAPDVAVRMGIDHEALQARIKSRTEGIIAEATKGQQANLAIAQVLASKLASKTANA